jgi:hypothetical protein
MQALVDTNVISDVLYGDPAWADWSKNQMVQHAEELVINPYIYAELCYRATSMAEAEQLIGRFRFTYAELPREALFLAAKAFQAYRKHGGVKTSPLADFFIGAHAAAAGLSILTRDTARYQTYFPGVPLICP